jgi:endonuclease/exonuclease/phosphatase family metal-dependent hydrolase
MKNKFALLLLLLVSVTGFSQEAKYKFDFEPESANRIKEVVSPERCTGIIDTMRPIFIKGINGYALNLSDDVSFRAPLKINAEEISQYSSDNSFAFQVWVKTKKNAVMGTPIAGNYNLDDASEGGWLIETHENGAWSLVINDGKTTYEYKPTVKQKINDGEWHQIAFSMDNNKEDVWMFLDGKNVAIYNIEKFKNLKNDFPTIVGGSNQSWNSVGRLEAFNGYIDEAKIWDTTISYKKVRELYSAYKHIDDLPVANNELKIFEWNIWHGGRRYGKNVGVSRVIDVIKSQNADVVALIETYGSGEEIADSLGYHFYLISSNLSIVSRYPIKETIKAFRRFNFGGVKLDLGNGKEVVILDTWLHYLPDSMGDVDKGKKSPKRLIRRDGRTRLKEVKKILKGTTKYLANADNVPVVMLGDFNVGSHLDWTEQTKDTHKGYVVEWPVSKEMEKHGFTDSYREINPDPLTYPGITWSPQMNMEVNKTMKDRIDFIYYKGKGLKAISSKVIDSYLLAFPSDHAGMLTNFELK